MRNIQNRKYLFLSFIDSHICFDSILPFAPYKKAFSVIQTFATKQRKNSALQKNVCLSFLFLKVHSIVLTWVNLCQLKSGVREKG